MEPTGKREAKCRGGDFLTVSVMAGLKWPEDKNTPIELADEVFSRSYAL